MARGLYNDDVTTPSQLAEKTNATTKWHGSSVRKILENPHYMGILKQCRDHKPTVTSKKRKHNSISDQVVIENSHEPIVPIEDFLVVQELIKSRKRTRPQSEKYLFTNTAFCSDCGRGMHFKKNRKGYICGNYNKHGIKACSNHYISQTSLTDIVLTDLNRISNKINKNNYYQSLIKEITLNKEQMREILETNINELEAKKRDKTNLVIALSNGIISNDDYQLAINSLNEVITNIVNENRKLNKELEHQDIEKDLKEFKKNLSSFTDLQVVTPELLHTLIDRIEIKADGTTKIHYRFNEPTDPPAY
uniref:Recombinase domain-containing protein n=1 Tax=Anaerobacillus isosaccharinicus TaxID=1532552 RepID=A0A1S2LCE7_9BACI